MKSFLYFSVFAVLIISCNNGPDANADNNNTGSLSKNTVKAISYSIIKSYPHDTSSFTQGLTFYNGELYEGTGSGRKELSKLMKVDLNTGKPLKEISLGDEYFGEGVTILRDTIYQLTWQEHVVFVYDLKTFRKIKEFPLKTDGWGLTTDGKELIVSDGTSNLYFYNPSTFTLLRTVAVKENDNLAFNLNELEYINGYVYANQWQLPYILKIDPTSGQVVAKADMQEVWNRVKVLDPDADVPNGIAYDSTTKKTYITGKLWPELYEVQFSY